MQMKRAQESAMIRKGHVRHKFDGFSGDDRDDQQARISRDLAFGGAAEGEKKGKKKKGGKDMHKIEEDNSEEEKDDSQFGYNRNYGDSIESSFDYQAELEKLEKKKRAHEEKKARRQQKAIN